MCAVATAEPVRTPVRRRPIAYIESRLGVTRANVRSPASISTSRGTSVILITRTQDTWLETTRAHTTVYGGEGGSRRGFHCSVQAEAFIMIIIISPLDIKDLSFCLSRSLSFSLSHSRFSSFSLSPSLPFSPFLSFSLCFMASVSLPLPLFRGLYALSLPSLLSLYPPTILSFASSPFHPAFPSFRRPFLSVRVALGFREMTIYKLLSGSLIQNASVDTRLVHYVKLIHRFLVIKYVRKCWWQLSVRTLFFLDMNFIRFFNTLKRIIKHFAFLSIDDRKILKTHAKKSN